MNQPSTSHRPADAERLAAVSRHVRRVCLLREQGDTHEADKVESTRLADEIRALREDVGVDAFTEADLRHIYEVERKRVADASALCDVLVPFLSDKALAPAPVAQPSPPVARMRTSISSRPASTEEGVPGISDMLDAMLAAERTGRRASPNNRSTT